VLTLVVLCILKGLWLGVVIPWLSAAFESLKTIIEWLLVTIVALVALSLIGRIVLRRFGRFLTLRRDPQTGDGYDINDSKDAKN
jgi:cell division protein FtsW (lipid II flippase)